MIKVNLAVLMAERGLRITDVSKQTGITRPTLTALVNNTGTAIQFETINKLCMFLKVEPQELLSYIPIDVKIKSHTLDMKNDTLNIEFGIIKSQKQYTCSLRGNVHLDVTSNEAADLVSNVCIDLELHDPGGNVELEYENKIISSTFSSLPKLFLREIESKIAKLVDYEIIEHYEYAAFSPLCETRINWDKDIIP